MPTHIVRQGECLSSIAARHGLGDWSVIYDHPQNAALRARRKNPNVLHPGDEVFIPPGELRMERGATATVHRFVLHRPKVSLRINLQDDKGNPHANCRYVLIVDGQQWEKTTDDKGLVEAKIPATATTGQLTVWLNDEDEEPDLEYDLQLRHLDPIDELSGVQARLDNLAFRCAIDGKMGPQTRAAVRAFRRTHGLADSDEIDDEFRHRLLVAHDGE